ncbi:MAG TPA: MFS transporter [Anaerolineae bacterium]
MSRRAKIVLICGALIVLISTGIRQSFGVFLQPITLDFGIGRETFSLALALQNLMFGLPLVGILADRIGARWVAAGGGLLYAAGLVLVATDLLPFGLFTSLGLLVGLALSATTYVVVLGAVAQVVPPARRGMAFGILTATGSFGMFAIVPLAQSLLSNFGWQSALMILAGLAGMMIVLAMGFPASPAGHPSRPETDPVEADSLLQVLSQARQHSGFLLLTAGFFVCGFHVAFIATHLPAFLADNGLTPGVAATALALIGLFNIVGSYTFGLLGDRYRKKYLLSFLYFARAVVISLFLVMPISNTTALVFGGAIGFLWLATIPLTSGLVAQIFGIRYLSTLYGIVFLSHQIGSFLGVWLGGRAYDMTGSYNAIWLASIVLALIATLLHTPISDRPAVRVQPV